MPSRGAAGSSQHGGCWVDRPLGGGGSEGRGALVEDLHGVQHAYRVALLDAALGALFGRCLRERALEELIRVVVGR